MQVLFCLPCSQPEKLENAVPFAIGIFRKLKPEFLVEWKVPKVLFKYLYNIRQHLDTTVCFVLNDTMHIKVAYYSYEGIKEPNFQLVCRMFRNVLSSS